MRGDGEARATTAAACPQSPLQHGHAYLLLSSMSRSGTKAIFASDCRDVLGPAECSGAGCLLLPVLPAAFLRRSLSPLSE